MPLAGAPLAPPTTLESVVPLLHAPFDPLGVAVTEIVTLPGQVVVSFLLVLAAAWRLWTRGRVEAAVCWTGAWLVAVAVEVVFRHTLTREPLYRHGVHLVGFDASWPSGHALRCAWWRARSAPRGRACGSRSGSGSWPSSCCSSSQASTPPPTSPVGCSSRRPQRPPQSPSNGQGLFGVAPGLAGRGAAPEAGLRAGFGFASDSTLFSSVVNRFSSSSKPRVRRCSSSTRSPSPLSAWRARSAPGASESRWMAPSLRSVSRATRSLFPSAIAPPRSVRCDHTESGCQPAQRVARAGVEHELRPGVPRGAAVVDDRERAAGGERLPRQRRDRMHLERGADHQEEAGLRRERLRPLERRRRQQLAEHDDTRLQDLPAFRARRQRQRAEGVVHRHSHATADAIRLAQRAVDLHDLA